MDGRMKVRRGSVILVHHVGELAYPDLTDWMVQSGIPPALYEKEVPPS